MKTKILILGVLVFISGCKTTKDIAKDKTDRTLKEQTEVITTRVGDTVRYEVPNFVFKDTVITKTNYVTGTTQRLYYNDQGALTAAECVSGFIEIIERSNRELIEAINRKDIAKTSEVSPVIVLYIVAALGIILVVAMVYFNRKINRLIP